MVRGPFEGFHLLDIREERTPTLGANRRHLLCREDSAPMFERTDGVNSAVAYKPGYCVRPFICNEVDCVLESAGNAVMVCCCHKDKSIKALNLVSERLVSSFVYWRLRGGCGSSRSGRSQSFRSTNS